MSGWETFQTEIKVREKEISSQLPSNVTPARFINAAIAAVKQNLSILDATPRSLFTALTKAAQDGLVPDGREGVITVYKQKIYNSNPAEYEHVAQWNPMIYGLRKRARELDGIVINTEVVYANDFFEREAGDNPRIIHKPAALDKDRGKAIGAYAIFIHPTEGILHREVMDAAQIETTRQQSRAKDSLMWTTFWTEGWRKVVARRGIKSVPVSAALERLVTREDDTFQFDEAAPKQITKGREPPAPPARAAIESNAAVPVDSHPVTGQRAMAPMERQPAELHNSDQPAGAESEARDLNSIQVEELLAQLERDLGYAQTEEEAQEAWDALDVERRLHGNDDAITRAFALKRSTIGLPSAAVRDDDEIGFR